MRRWQQKWASDWLPRPPHSPLRLLASWAAREKVARGGMRQRRRRSAPAQQGSNSDGEKSSSGGAQLAPLSLAGQGAEALKRIGQGAAAADSLLPPTTGAQRGARRAAAAALPLSLPAALQASCLPLAALCTQDTLAMLSWRLWWRKCTPRGAHGTPGSWRRQAQQCLLAGHASAPCCQQAHAPPPLQRPREAGPVTAYGSMSPLPIARFHASGYQQPGRPALPAAASSAG